MGQIDRIIFVDKDGTSREAMAMGILKDLLLRHPVDVLARGLIVQFPEPINQKVEAVLISNGIVLNDYVSQPLLEEDVTGNTLILTMAEKQRAAVLESFPFIAEEQAAVLSAYVGEELEVIDPYGGNVQVYGLCFESLRRSIRKLVEMLNSEEAVGGEQEGEEDGQA